MKKMRNKTSYQNFNVAVYCPVHNVNSITDEAEFESRFRHLTDHVKIGRAYVECYRGLEWASKEQLLKVKAYFEGKEIGRASCRERV